MPTEQQIANADVDLNNLGLVVNGAPGTVTLRGGTVVKTLSKLIGDQTVQEQAANAAAATAVAARDKAQAWAQQPTGDVDTTNFPGQHSAYYYAKQVGDTLATLPGALTLTGAAKGSRTKLANGKLVATSKRLLATDDFSYNPNLPVNEYPAGSVNYIVGAWSAAHRGLVASLPGVQNYLSEVELPAGYRTLSDSARFTIALMRSPTNTPLPLTSGGTQPFMVPVKVYPDLPDNDPDAYIINSWDLSAQPNQTLPALVWNGRPIAIQPGDLLVGWGKDVAFNYVQDPGNSPATFFFDINVADRPDPNNPLGGGTNNPGMYLPVQSTGVQRFSYKAKISAGDVRAGFGGPSSLAVIDSDGLLAGGGFPELKKYAESTRSDVLDLQQAVTALGGGVGPKADAQLRYFIAPYTTGSNLVTLRNGDNAFTAADVGKLIYCTVGGNGATQPQLPVSTITQYISPTQVRVSNTWAFDGTGGTAISYDVELIWGSDDTAALQALGFQARKTGLLKLPAGEMILRQPVCDARDLPNKTISVEGAGGRGTIIRVAPDFNWSLLSGQPNRGVLIMHTNATNGILPKPTYRGFTIQGPLTGWANLAAGTTVLPVFHFEPFVCDVEVNSFSGVTYGIDIRASSVTLVKVRSKQHTSYNTIGIRTLADTVAVDVHTGNCNGAGFLAQGQNDSGNAQPRLTLLGCLFDEAGDNGQNNVVIDNARAHFFNTTLFGGPNQTAWALDLKNGAKASFTGTTAEGYGTASPRNAVKVGAGCTLNLKADSKIQPGGNGTGIALSNAGTVVVDDSSVVIGTTQGTAVRNLYPGNSIPAALAGGASNSDIIALVNALRTSVVSSGMGVAA